MCGFKPFYFIFWINENLMALMTCDVVVLLHMFWSFQGRTNHHTTLFSSYFEVLTLQYLHHCSYFLKWLIACFVQLPHVRSKKFPNLLFAWCLCVFSTTSHWPNCSISFTTSIGMKVYVSFPLLLVVVTHYYWHLHQDWFLSF
jgi:hypothetical protein